MRGAWVAIVVAGIAVLGGCTAILGLENVSSVDRDNDNVPDAVDNCPDDSNPDQSDFDRNGKGDACDLCTDGGADDVDNDGIPDGCDGCIGTGMDVDNDRIDDGCDACIGSGVDADDDNIDDACDACIGNGLDADHDMIDDACDTCVQTFTDIDNDTIDDGCDACVASPANIDDDGDGIENMCDPCPIGPQHDEDGDGVFDACDTCKVSMATGQSDNDGDGVGDGCETDNGIDYERMDPFVVLDPAWFAEGASWSVTNDTVRLVSLAAAYRWLSPLRGNSTISARVRFAPQPILQGNPGVGLVAFDSASSAANRQIVCRVDENGRVITTLTVGGINAGFEFSTGTVNPSSYFTLTMVLSDSKKTLVCSASDGNSKPSAQIDYDQPGVLWFPGLRVEAADASFEYFDQIGGLP